MLRSLASVQGHDGATPRSLCCSGSSGSSTRTGAAAPLIALPPELRRRYQLDRPGAQVEITERPDGVLEIRPTLAIPASQAWFWTEAWQKREREADADIAAGRVTTYDDVDAFVDDLPS